MGKIPQVVKEFVEFLTAFLSAENLAIATAVSGILYKVFRSMKKSLNAKQDEMLEEIRQELNTMRTNQDDFSKDINKEVLRLQILSGIHENRLSDSEVLYFFDKYKALGGNSFVEDKVESYLLSLKEGGVNKDG